MLGLALLVVIGFWVIYATNNPNAWPDLKAAFGAGSASQPSSTGGGAPATAQPATTGQPGGYVPAAQSPIGEPIPIQRRAP
jgi:hypothetical protein